MENLQTTKGRRILTPEEYFYFFTLFRWTDEKYWTLVETTSHDVIPGELWEMNYRHGDWREKGAQAYKMEPWKECQLHFCLCFRRCLFLSVENFSYHWILLSRRKASSSYSRERISLIGQKGDGKFGQAVDKYKFPVFLISESVFYPAISLPISKLKSERSWIPTISGSI